ncbi:MAG: MFS transporter [Candidatus Thorarchaeota archaeon]|jgi:MFS family permease
MANLYHRALSISTLNPEAKHFISRATSLMLAYSFTVMLTNTFLILHALEFVTLTELSIIIAVQFAIQAIASYPSGALGDWIGQRWVLCTAALAYGVGFIVLSQAIDFTTILIAFILVALAQSQESGTFVAWFDNNYKLYATEDKDRRTYSEFYGKFTMFSNILMAISFILGGFVITFLGRPLMFVIQGALLVLVSFLLLRFIKDHKDLNRDKMSVRAYLRYLRGGMETVVRNKTLRLMVLGLMISGAGWAIWGGLILFPLYASYATTDAWTAILRSIIFICGALCTGVAGILSKRIKRLQKWLALAVLLVDVLFFIGIFVMLTISPAPSAFSLISFIFVILTFTIAFAPRYLVDVLRPRFYLDVVPDENRNAVYSLIPTLTMIVSIFAVPIGGVLIETLGQETSILILALNGLFGSGITAYAIYRHKVEQEISGDTIDLCCPVFPSKILDTQAIVPLSLPCCWSFDPVTEYIWSQLKETAYKDHVFTKEEGTLIESIVIDVREYGEVLKRALEDEAIDKTEQQLLMKARERIWIEANNLATTSEGMSDDIKEILNRLKQLLEYVDAGRMFQIPKSEDS